MIVTVNRVHWYTNITEIYLNIADLLWVNWYTNITERCLGET